jgi:D-alanyl-D-alanine carboxypeptidase
MSGFSVLRLAFALLAGLCLPTVAWAAPYASCGDASPAAKAAAVKNGESLDSIDWAPFGPKELGWQVYEPRIGQEIDTHCGAGTPAFAHALSVFQARYGLEADGVFGSATFQVLKGLWQERRPFVMQRVAGFCPDAPPADLLAPIPSAQETFERTDRALRHDVLEAYERMLAAARSEVRTVHDDPKSLSIFSGYRSPESDARRCAVEQNCDGGRRAVCSPHRTGSAIDLNVGWITGEFADTTMLENRKWQVRSPSYLWLVANARRFGFVNYAFEPWHWEYVGPPTETP